MALPKIVPGPRRMWRTVRGPQSPRSSFDAFGTYAATPVNGLSAAELIVSARGSKKKAPTEKSGRGKSLKFVRITDRHYKINFSRKAVGHIKRQKAKKWP